MDGGHRVGGSTGAWPRAALVALVGLVAVIAGPVASAAVERGRPAGVHGRVASEPGGRSRAGSSLGSGRISSVTHVFGDGFETGDLSQWSGRFGLRVQRRDVYTGTWAARASSAGSASYAQAALPGSYPQLDLALRFKLVSHAGAITLIELRSASGAAIVAISVRQGAGLTYFNGVTRTLHRGAATVRVGRWHLLDVNLRQDGVQGRIVVRLDGRKVDLSGTDDFGSAPIGVVRLGNSAPGRTYTADFDEVTIAAGAQGQQAGAFFGAWVQMADRSCTSSSNQDAAMAALEVCAGHALGADREYHKWDDVFPTAHERNSRDAGRTIVMSWKAQLRSGHEVQWADIAAGRYDDVIDARAADIRAFGANVYLIFHHEPEDEVDDENGSAADFVAAWRHIHGRFTNDGVTNVRWLLDLMTWTFDPKSGRDPEDYWPGSAYVDAVGADGYNWYGCRGSNWVSFGDEFSGFYDWSVEKSKPAIAPEWGSTEDPSDHGRKARWITDAAAWVKAHPNIVGMAYFDSPADCTWWADTTPQSLAAFAKVAQDPYFQADASTE